MGKFWAWFKRVVIGEFRDEPNSGMTAHAIVINPNDVVRFQLAAYRIDAIKRHILQHDNVSVERMREFFAETVAHADILLRAKRIGVKDYDAIVNFVHKML